MSEFNGKNKKSDIFFGIGCVVAKIFIELFGNYVEQTYIWLKINMTELSRSY